MKKQIFTTILLWALAQMYLVLGIGFVANSFVFNEWNILGRYMLFVLSTIITFGFIHLFVQRK